MMCAWISNNPAIFTAAVGVLSAVLGAILKGAFDEWGQAKRLRFERQQKLIDAQSALLDELGIVCWKWRYDATRVAYYGKESKQKEYECARKSYGENIWTNLNKIRFMGTQAGRLFSRSALDEIEKFYGHVDDVDTDIEEANQEQDAAARQALFKKIYLVVRDKIRMEIADLILGLAKNVDLVPRK